MLAGRMEPHCNALHIPHFPYIIVHFEPHPREVRFYEITIILNRGHDILRDIFKVKEGLRDIFNRVIMDVDWRLLILRGRTCWPGFCPVIASGEVVPGRGRRLAVQHS